MGIAHFVKSIFKKPEEQKKTSDSLLDRINASMELLVQKSRNLNDQFSEEKEEIMRIAEDARSIRESEEIFSAKLEQDILGNITAVSSACDAALSGRSQCAVKESLLQLKAVVAQRLAK